MSRMRTSRHGSQISGQTIPVWSDARLVCGVPARVPHGRVAVVVATTVGRSAAKRLVVRP